MVVAGDGICGVRGGGRGAADKSGPLVKEGHDGDRGEVGTVAAMLVGVDHSWLCRPTANMAFGGAVVASMVGVHNLWRWWGTATVA